MDLITSDETKVRPKSYAKGSVKVYKRKRPDVTANRSQCLLSEECAVAVAGAGRWRPASLICACDAERSLFTRSHADKYIRTTKVVVPDYETSFDLNPYIVTILGIRGFQATPGYLTARHPTPRYPHQSYWRHFIPNPRICASVGIHTASYTANDIL
ncbi:hypothetical protein KGM_213783 [Danaus plexippus plexippus]|uniref:Uncharacterized protein n=1 Tax=Danaus plexippus plexippus TaxID=278856 RepID=A0A212FGJ4_DANPL|nr:hypothetical protein KGM_213783 [Danaus plexippus plexippus]